MPVRKMEARGYRLQATEGLMVLSSFAIDHRRRDAPQLFHEAARKAADARLLRLLRWWSRRCTAIARQIARMPDGVDLLVELIRADPEGWRLAICSVIPHVQHASRVQLLDALRTFPSRETVDALGKIDGSDVQEVRRELIQRLAPRLFIRTFGDLTVHRGAWTGPQITVEKRRLRQLLSLLAAHTGRKLTRDEAADALWPEADAVSAGNSLNQAMFQLRRVLDPTYRDGESPAYLLTSADSVELNPRLVQTDLAWIRRSAGLQRGPGGDSAIALIRGGFLPELRFEDWGSAVQASVHAEMRETLLPIAEQDDGQASSTTAIRAACALVEMDPFDERAQIALANATAADGRRVAARQALSRFAARFRQELDEEPSEALQAALLALAAPQSSSA